MKILYFNYLWDIHGASIGSAVKPMELFKALEEFGHEVKICWMKKQPESGGIEGSKRTIRDVLKKHLAPWVHDPKLFFENFSFLKKEQQLVQAFKPDVIVSRLDLYLFSAVRTARKNGLPIIIEADSPPLYEALAYQQQYHRIKAIPERIEKKVLQQADRIVMQSNVLKDHFIEKYKLNPDLCTVAPNAVNPAKFEQTESDQDLRKKINPLEGPVVGFVGSLSAWHGVENLQKLIAAVVAKHPNVLFLVVGTGGGLEPQMRQFLERENLSQNVTFTGYVPHEEIPQYVSLMDVAVAPYPNLDFFYYSPVKVYEYMAAGKAVVTTDIGQIAEVLTHEHDGLLTRPGSVDDLIQSVRRLLADKPLRARLGHNARHTILAGHTWRHRAAQWNEVLLRLAKEKGIETRKTGS